MGAAAACQAPDAPSRALSQQAGAGHPIAPGVQTLAKAHAAELPLEPVSGLGAAADIAGQIERLVFCGHLTVGDRLPTERRLAEQLAVSRTIVREAVAMLAQKGIVEVRQRSGIYVARPRAETLHESLRLFFHFNRASLIDLVEARLALEVEIAGLAAARASGHDRVELDTILAQLEAAANDLEAYVDADLRFHAALARIAKNPFLETLIDTIRTPLRENMLVIDIVYGGDKGMTFHRRIAAAVRRGEAAAARAAMREHLEDVRNALEAIEERAAMMAETATAGVQSA